MLKIILLMFLLPVCLFLGLFSHILHNGSGYNSSDYSAPITPWRWLFAFLVPIYIVKNGLSKKSLDYSGAITAFVVGFILTLANYGFFFALLSFFLAASKATKHKSDVKRKIEADFKEGGQRNWAQVLCNGGVATEFTLVLLMDCGVGEQVIDFREAYNASWLCASVIGALACSCGDTFASELGTVYGKGKPWLITTLSQVPKGTNGGVSIVGLIFSTLGGALVGAAYYIALLLFVKSQLLATSPPQYPIILVGALMGLIGSMVDSILGATVQYSGLDTELGVVVERHGPKVHHISGMEILDNHGVNMLSSLLSSLIAPHVALTIWDACLH